MAEVDDLLDDIFDGKKTPLYREFGGWARDSRRFRAFAAGYRVKIRAKLKYVRDQEGMNDLRAELETAALLLREERFTVEYEKYAATKQRGPDFTVTFKTHTPFNVEVRRIRGGGSQDPAGGAPGGATPGDEARTGKLMAALGDKVGQMPPGIVNLLWVVTDGEIDEADLAAATTTLRQLAEHKVEDFFTRRGFESAAAFLRQYGRLSGIVLRQPAGSTVWLNPLARHKAPPEIVTAIQRLGPM